MAPADARPGKGEVLLPRPGPCRVLEKIRGALGHQRSLWRPVGSRRNYSRAEPVMYVNG